MSRVVESADKPEIPGDRSAAGQSAVDSLSPVLVVERFLEFLRRGDLDEALALLAVDVVYENVGLPTVHGRERVRRLFGRAYDGGGGFDVVIHTICADGASVLTERTDFLTFRKLHIRVLGLRALRRARRPDRVVARLL